MKAYQYFWRNGRIIGRIRAGTMGFDSRRGHHHWHFEQFARYNLLTANKKLAVRSHKQGFCLGPDDPVDLAGAARRVAAAGDRAHQPVRGGDRIVGA